MLLHDVAVSHFRELLSGQRWFVVVQSDVTTTRRAEERLVDLYNKQNALLHRLLPPDVAR